MLKKIFQKSTDQEQMQPPSQGTVTKSELDPRIILHYGIPTTASVLAVDPVQSLLAVGTLDGRIKVLGGDNIEGILMSPKQLPFKNLEFMHNQGFLASVSNENDIQVWDLKNRQLASTLHWESNITAFSVIYGTSYMCIGDEYGAVYVIKYDAGEGVLKYMPYQISQELVAAAAGISSSDQHSVVGVLPQPSSCGNRLLITYENGLIILWDVSEDQAVLVRGKNYLQLKDAKIPHHPENIQQDVPADSSDEESVEKEISSVCWASTDGSILAVGYVDGDILLWNLSSSNGHHAEKSSEKVVKLQLSSSSRRLPVILLRWSENKSAGHSKHGCRLFVYGGGEIGSDEVLTVLNLDWASGIESLKCLGRLDLTLNGSFSDMVLLSRPGAAEGNDLIFVLSNPGQLHLYDDDYLSALMSQPEKKASLSALQYPTAIPMVEPQMTVGKLGLVCHDGKLSEMVPATKIQTSHALTPVTAKWPLKGGAHSQLSDAEINHIERLYIAGYQDGSVRIWDATFLFLKPIAVVGGEVKGVNIEGLSAPISALDYCSSTLSFAIGNQYGLVRLYKLMGTSDETELQIVTENGKKAHKLKQSGMAPCIAIFSILPCSISNLQFTNSGARLAVGFDSGQVAILDNFTLSVLFLTDCVTKSASPIISLAVKSLNTDDLVNSPNDSEPKSMNNLENEVVFLWTKNGDVVLLDSTSGSVLRSSSMHLKQLNAVSLHLLEDIIFLPEVSSEKKSLELPSNDEARTEHEQGGSQSGSTAHQLDKSSKSPPSAGKLLLDSSVIVCCEDTLSLCSLKSIIEEDSKSIRKLTLDKPCCWTTTLKKDGKECGLVILYRTGVLEIRSFPDLEVVQEISLMSILRWNYKTTMEKTICSSDSGHFVLVNGSEFAFMSLLACEDDFRIPRSLPLLHDEGLATAADATLDLYANEKKKKGASTGFMGGIIKGFKGDKVEQNVDFAEVRKNYFAHLEKIFSRSPLDRLFSSDSLLESPEDSNDDQKVIELNIDDIEIDEPVIVSSSSQNSDNNPKGKQTERERLFDGATSDTKPRPRTVEEIKAKYKNQDVSQVTAEARNKLIERQEKLERLRKNTEELQSGAENFASLASQLAKQMEKRKWWNI